MDLSAGITCPIWIKWRLHLPTFCGGGVSYSIWKIKVIYFIILIWDSDVFLRRVRRCSIKYSLDGAEKCQEGEIEAVYRRVAICHVVNIALYSLSTYNLFVAPQTKLYCWAKNVGYFSFIRIGFWCTITFYMGIHLVGGVFDQSVWITILGSGIGDVSDITLQHWTVFLVQKL